VGNKTVVLQGIGNRSNKYKNATKESSCKTKIDSIFFALQINLQKRMVCLNMKITGILTLILSTTGSAILYFYTRF
jgi:hypothetical protein